MTKPAPDLDPATLSAVIEAALSDHVSFDAIRADFGLTPDQVQAVMRDHLRVGSYRAWRKRVQKFSARREIYK